MLQMWYPVYCNLNLGTLGWRPLVRACLWSHFWIVTCLNKLSCLVPRILSLMFWTSCKIWSEIHISLASWLSGYISRCTRCVHLWCMCADRLVLKNCEDVQINCFNGNWWWWNLYLYIWSSIYSIPIWFRIFLFCCMLRLTYNISSLILRVGKGSHWQIKNSWIDPYFGGVWTWEGARVSLGWSCGALWSFWFPCLVWALFEGYIWILVCWCCLW